MTTARIIAIAIALSLGTSAIAQKRPAAPSAKKLYCWTQNGRKVCGDALPAEAAEGARTEISVKSGLRTGEVARALTTEERADAATAVAQAKVAADADAVRQRRDLAMVESYGTEADLRHAYGERIGLLDASLKASDLGESNLRLSLISLLNQASDQELAGKPVTPMLVSHLRTQHAELEKTQRILIQQHHDRAALDGELSDAVTRYRTLKQPQSGAAAVLAPATAPNR